MSYLVVYLIGVIAGVGLGASIMDWRQHRRAARDE